MTHVSAGDSWTRPGESGQFLVGSLLLSHGSWCTQCSIYALQKSISQSCGGTGQQWTAAGAGALGAADLDRA